MSNTVNILNSSANNDLKDAPVKIPSQVTIPLLWRVNSSWKGRIRGTGLGCQIHQCASTSLIDVRSKRRPIFARQEWLPICKGPGLLNERLEHLDI